MRQGKVKKVSGKKTVTKEGLVFRAGKRPSVCGGFRLLHFSPSLLFPHSPQRLPSDLVTSTDRHSIRRGPWGSSVHCPPPAGAGGVLQPELSPRGKTFPWIQRTDNSQGRKSHLGVCTVYLELLGESQSPAPILCGPCRE